MRNVLPVPPGASKKIKEKESTLPCRNCQHNAVLMVLCSSVSSGTLRVIIAAISTVLYHSSRFISVFVKVNVLRFGECIPKLLSGKLAMTMQISSIAINASLYIASLNVIVRSLTPCAMSVQYIISH
ncbi:hypothetical protein TNCT_553051 [Trichonephila clavata]|uniref:Uncharacterized protein n=1 Tax=Trichonephila clavata TaxID=2740835 RepID=A0A8X6GPJ3_TRICU|nr:hypothetical protein TNCT_553051 [Trichonephila clavata]